MKREIAMRERVYPNWVKNGKMKLDQADYQIEAMRAVLRTLTFCGDSKRALDAPEQASSESA